VSAISNSFIRWSEFTVPNALRVLGIFLVALILNRILRVLTNLIVKPAASKTRGAQAREQQTRTVATVLYGAGSKVVWALAILTAIPEFGININPVVALAGLGSLALGFGAQNLVRDVISGFYIILEDQYAVGDTVQIGATEGRVDHLTLRRTVVRDARGALVTIANGDVRTVANLSRDWSQAFADVTFSSSLPLERVLKLLEAAAGGLRGDPAWAPALVDGPRVLGVQAYDSNGCTIRLQVRTAPTRQDEVARELRRRIQNEFQREALPLRDVQRVEIIHAPAMRSEDEAPQAGARTI